MRFSLRSFFRDCFCWDRPFARNVLLVALPMVLQELVGASLHIVDSLMVSGLGDASYAAVTQANRFSFVFQLFCFGTASGGAIFMSQYHGAGDTARMRQSMGLSLVAVLILSALFTGAALLAPRTIVGCFLQPGESFELAVQYLLTVAPSYVLVAVSTVYASCLKSGETTLYPMIGGVASIAVNTVLNYGMIYGRLGFAPMGVKGAAIATVIAAAVQLAVNIAYAYGKRLPAGATLPQMLCHDRAFVKRFAKTVTPVIFNEGLWSLGTTMYGVYYGTMGDLAVAATGVCTTIDNLVWTVIFGMMNATAIIVGKALGAGQKENAYLYAKRMIAGAMLAGVALGGTLIAIREPILSLYGGLSPEVLDTARKILLFGGLTMWFRAFNTINVVGVLRSGGDTVFSLILDVGSLWTVGVLLAGLATFVFRWPVEYVYLCTISEEIVKMAVGIPHFIKRGWMKNLTAEQKEGATLADA